MRYFKSQGKRGSKTSNFFFRSINIGELDCIVSRRGKTRNANFEFIIEIISVANNISIVVVFLLQNSSIDGSENFYIFKFFIIKHRSSHINLIRDSFSGSGSNLSIRDLDFHVRESTISPSNRDRCK